MRTSLLAVTTLVAALLTTAVIATTGPAYTDPPPTAITDIDHRDACEATRSPVRLTPDDPTTYTVAGWLCGPSTRTDELVFAVHGFSYDHRYWLGLGYDRLDAVHALANSGRPTFIIDQIGAGRSSHPDPAQVTFPHLALVLHQLVHDLRTGTIGRHHTHYTRIIGLGHSMGAGTWIIEAGTYHDVDGLALCDFLHQTDPAMVSTLMSDDYVPANSLPRWSDMPSGYLTIEPRSVFYDLALADPNVITRDEQIGISTGAQGQPQTLAAARDPAQSQAITVPVLLVSGQQDSLGCNTSIGLSCASAAAIMQREGADYTAAPCLDAFVLPSGHDTDLHPAAPQLFAYLDWWLTAAAHHVPLACLPRP